MVPRIRVWAASTASDSIMTICATYARVSDFDQDLQATYGTQRRLDFDFAIRTSCEIREFLLLIPRSSNECC